MYSLLSESPGIKPVARGFTLIEMLVVVAIGGILAAVAAPSLISVIESNRRAIISNQLMEDLAFARRQAIALSSSVALCGSDSTQPTTCTGDTDWSNGWYTYIGKSAGLTPASAAAGLVMRSPQALPSGWKVDAHLSSPGTHVYVDARSATTRYGYFTVYRSGSATAACVVVNSVGRARTSTATVTTGAVSPASAQDPCKNLK